MALTAVLAWWLAATVLGLLATPIARHLFRALPDQGYSLARPLGVLLFSYLVWLLGLTHVVPNGPLSAALALAALFALWLLLVRRNPREWRDWLRRSWRQIVLVEALFALALILFALFRSYSPAIAGTEKPMEFAFLNGILRSRAFPPADPWLSGHSISYYYLGYLQAAALTNLTGTLPSVAFNLAQALVFALAAVGAYGLTYNLVALWHRPAEGTLSRAGVWLGLLGVALLLILGSLVGVFELLRAHGAGSPGLWDLLSIKGLDANTSSTSWHPTEFWWWWRSTRVIDTVVDGISRDYTITEFPFFSFLLGDLHPHVLALPYALLALGISLAVLVDPATPGVSALRARPWAAVVMALCLGALGFLNSWDLPTYSAVFVGALAVRSHLDADPSRRHPGLRAAAFALPILAGAALFYLPFYGAFSSQASGIMPVGRYATRYLHFFLVIGPLFLPAAGFALVLAWRSIKGRLWRPSDVLWGLTIALAPFLVWAAATLWLADPASQGLSLVVQRLLHLLPLLALIALAGTALASLAQPRPDAARPSAPVAASFCLLIVLVAFLVLLAPELFYLRDLFNNRMNTVFKLYYQAWLLLAVAVPFCLYYLAHSWRPAPLFARAAKWAWLGAVALLLGAGFVYSVAALPSRADALGQPTLDGLASVRRRDPQLMEALEQLKTLAPPGSVVVEATGGSYTEYGRVSEVTGIPTLLGWAGHEQQWRGSTRPFEGRAEDIDRIYRAQDGPALHALLAKYSANFVFVGEIERARYGQDTAARLSQFLTVAYSNDSATILMVKS